MGIVKKKKPEEKEQERDYLYRPFDRNNYNEYNYRLPAQAQVQESHNINEYEEIV